MPARDPEPLPPRTLYFDGVCNFCNGAVRWLIDRDPQRRLHFGSLQGETAAALRARHPDFPRDLDSVVFCEVDADGERLFTKSDAVLRVVAEIARPWRWLVWARWLPRPFRDWAYGRFAKHRYRMFGRLEACPVPSVADRARFVL
jgi:predicted DCC family thiol-disulfide oxidoreductase YuxK